MEYLNIYNNIKNSVLFTNFCEPDTSVKVGLFLMILGEKSPNRNTRARAGFGLVDWIEHRPVH